MVNRRINLSIIIFFMSFILIFFLFILTAQISFGIDLFESNKNVSMKIASDNDAFVGINVYELYEDVTPGDVITFSIINNLPGLADYELELVGTPIQEFSPSNFTLLPGEEETIVVNVLGDIEAIEGPYNIVGNVVANSNDEIIYTGFDFGINVQQSVQHEGE